MADTDRTLIETRVSEIQPGDQWLLDGHWVDVAETEVKHPDDRVTVYYMQDGEAEVTTSFRGFEVAVVKRPGKALSVPGENLR